MVTAGEQGRTVQLLNGLVWPMTHGAGQIPDQETPHTVPDCSAGNKSRPQNRFAGFRREAELNPASEAARGRPEQTEGGSQMAIRHDDPRRNDSLDPREPGEALWQARTGRDPREQLAQPPPLQE
ncbi:hypothetical protein P7K49_031278, partial [Saguinus oedipus]